MPESEAETSPLQQLLVDNGLDDPDSPGWLTLSREVRLNDATSAASTGAQ